MANKSFVLAHLDDDPLELKRFVRIFSKEPACVQDKVDFKIHSFTNSESFLNFIATSSSVDFCVLDIVLSSEERTNGLSFIQSIKSHHPQCVVSVCSFNDNPSWILKSLSLQADDFFSKRIWPENLKERLLQSYNYVQIKLGNLNSHTLLSSQNDQTEKGYTACAGKTLKSVERRIPLILQSAVRCVLIEGESGTGKEVVTDIFAHYTKNFPFIRLNCAAIAQNLLESELFGHKKGAFTGALTNKVGFIEAAHNGFLFLDEISSLSLAAQSALLRAIENQEIIRIGETHARKVNVKFICATNVSLKEMVEKNTFRKDLWQRLREVDIYLPPLHERKEEIPELIDFFCMNFKERVYAIDPLAKDVLCTLDWKEGNVRELRNTLRAMTEFAQNGILGVNAIPNRIFANLNSADKSQNAVLLEHEIKISLYSETQKPFKYEELCDNLLRNIILHHKQKSGKLNISQLSKELGISRSTLHEKLKNF